MCHSNIFPTFNEFSTILLYRYTSNLGDTVNHSGYYEKLLGKGLADNKWHQVDVKRIGNKMDLRVDIDRVTFELPGKLTTLDLDGKIYIAGIDEEGKVAFRRQREQYPFVFFAGCLEDAVINRINVLQKAKNKTHGAVVHGNEVYGCKEETGYRPITFLTSASFLLVHVAELNTFNFSFKFRTYESNGMLLHQQLQNKGGAEILLSLENGRVKLQVTYQKPHLPVTLHAGFSLQDGFWHTISVSISSLSVMLLVDKEKTSYIIDSSFGVQFSNSRNVKIAASYKKTSGFIGCMYKISVQGQEINLTSAMSGLRVLRGKCSFEYKGQSHDYNLTSTTLPLTNKESLTIVSSYSTEAATTAATTAVQSSNDSSITFSSVHTDSLPEKPLTKKRQASKTTALSLKVTSTSHTTETGPTTEAYFDRNPPPVVIIDSPRKYITIKEDSNQELVLIILSIILALFIFAIIALIIKQQILYACKCIDISTYRDVQQLNSIELGTSSLYGHNEPEILQYETSPYSPRDGYGHEYSYRGMTILSPRAVIRLSGRGFDPLTQSESDVDTDTDQLDVSNDSSLTSNSSCSTNGCPNEKLKPIVEVEESEKGSNETIPLTSSQSSYKIHDQYDKLKDVFLDVISRNNYQSPRTLQDKNQDKNILTSRNKLENSNLNKKRKLSSASADFSNFPSDHESSTTLSGRTLSCGEVSANEESKSFSPENSLCGTTKSCLNTRKYSSKDSLNAYLTIEDSQQENVYYCPELNQPKTLKIDFSAPCNNTSTENLTKPCLNYKNQEDFKTSKNYDIVIVNRSPENGEASMLDSDENDDLIEQGKNCSFNDKVKTEKAKLPIHNKQKHLIFNSESSLEVSSEEDALVCDEYKTEI